MDRFLPSPPSPSTRLPRAWLRVALAITAAFGAVAAACDDLDPASIEAREGEACVLGELVIETFDPAAIMTLVSATASSGELGSPLVGPSCAFQCACVFEVDPRCADGAEPIYADPSGVLPPPHSTPTITVPVEGASDELCDELAAEVDGPADGGCWMRCAEDEQPPFYGFEDGGVMLCCESSLFGIDDDPIDPEPEGGPWQYPLTGSSGTTASSSSTGGDTGTSSSTGGDTGTSSSTGGDTGTSSSTGGG